MSDVRLEVALETSTRRPSVAARLGERTLERELTAGRAHASDLLPCLAELLAELGSSPAALGAVFVGSGPGSYTGLRVGMATALGLARGSGAALFSLPSLELLAWEALQVGQAAAIVLDARQGELYLGRYARDERELHVLRAPCVVPAAQLAGELRGGEDLYADEGALALDLPGSAAPRPAPAARARVLLELAARRMQREGPRSPEDIAPLYLRPFHAQPRRR